MMHRIGLMMSRDDRPLHAAGCTRNLTRIFLVHDLYIETGHDIRLTVHTHPALLALNDGEARAVGILCTGANRVECRIRQDCRTGCINSVETSVREICCSLRTSKQPDNKIYVIKIDIIERASGALRIERRRHLACQIIRITARILRIIELSRPNIAQIWQFFLHQIKNLAVHRGDCLKHILACLLRKSRELLRLRRRRGQRLLKDNILAREQSLLRIREMRAVHETDVDRLRIGFSQQLIVVCVDFTDSVLFRQCFGFFLAVRAGKYSHDLHSVDRFQGK